MFCGLNATQKNDYPITVKTGHSLSEIIISRKRIDYTGIDSPEYLLIISKEGLKKVEKIIAYLDENCTLLADESLVIPETKAKVKKLPFDVTAKKISRQSVATIAFAALLKDSNMFPLQALETSISTFQKPEIAETNQKALKAGSELISE